MRSTSELVVASPPGSSAANVRLGITGMAVPTGREKLNVAAWMVPNGDAKTGARQFAALAVWRAISAPIS